MEKKVVSVVVLGDVGRSPRMQYHALSLAREGFDVDVIGYGGSEPFKEFNDYQNVTFRFIPACPEFSGYCPRFLLYAFKVFWNCVTLFLTLTFKRRSHYVLVQTPPAIPSLGICWLYCILTNAKFIIDWHNYAYTIMALSLGRENALVCMSKWFEEFFGRKADANICVTKAMKSDLALHNIQAVTLYDRPPETFKPISTEAKHQLLLRLSQEYDVFQSTGDDKTDFTKIGPHGTVLLRDDRPGLVVSSTSWTEDEDFSILMSALQDYEDCCLEGTSTLPPIICVITGKGPLKQYYCDLIDKKAWQYIKVVTPWLQSSDYPLLLASADVGVCLHISSSGLDLPMKIADMFGCGLPVCAHGFLCLHELVQHEKNSYVFNTPDELASQIKAWFSGFPNNKSQQNVVKRFKKELESYQSLRWHENWMLCASQIFK